MKLFFPFLFALSLGAASAFGQASQGITNAQLKGSNNNLVSGATLNFASGSTFNFLSGADTNLLFVHGSGGLVLPLQLGSGISITGSGPYTLTVGSSTSANPTASVGLSAVNGSATSFMRSDAAPALSQAIVPTWTGLHSFDVTAAATSGSDYGMKILPTLNQRNATNFSMIFGNETVTQAGTGNQYLEQYQVGGTNEWVVDSTGTVQVGAWNGTEIPIAKLATIAANTMIANATGSTAAPTASTLSAFLDSAIDNTQGDILFRNSTAWTFLGPGTSGQFLSTGGAAANPSWATGPTGPGSSTNNDLVIFSGTSGSIFKDSSGITAAAGVLTATGTDATLASSNTNGNVNLTTNGSGLVKVTAPGIQLGTAVAAPSFTPWLSAYVDGGGSEKASSLVRMCNTNNINPAMYFQFARGTNASPTATQSGDQPLNLFIGVYDGSWVLDTANITFQVTENQSSGHHGNEFIIQGTPNASGSIQNTFKVVGDGTAFGGAGATQQFLNGSGKVLGSDITGDTTAQGGNFITDTAGKTLLVKSGSNAKAGTFTMASGTVTVMNSSVTANSVVVCSVKTSSGTPGLYGPEIVIAASTGFTATGAVTDNSTYNYVILEVN